MEHLPSTLLRRPDFISHSRLDYSPVARTTSYDGNFEDMPVSVRRAMEADRSYYSQALCSTDTGSPKIAWLAEPGRRYTYGGHTYRGERLIELARSTCALCPVQWDCAITAIEAGESAGIWSDTIENLRWLRRTYPIDFAAKIDMARSTGVTVQRAIKMLRSRLI